MVTMKCGIETGYLRQRRKIVQQCSDRREVVRLVQWSQRDVTLQPRHDGMIDQYRARVIRAGGRLVWAEAEVLAGSEVIGKFNATGIRVSFDPQSYLGERGSE